MLSLSADNGVECVRFPPFPPRTSTRYLKFRIGTCLARNPQVRHCDRIMKTLLVLYHSATGGTRQMADAAVEGARAEPHMAVRLSHVRDAAAADIIAADGFIFATPETLGTISGLMKDFFDRSYYAALGRIEGRPYATMVCAGSDGRNAAAQLARIATGWRLRLVAEPLIVCTSAQTPEAIMAPKVIAPSELDRCRDLGAALAAGLAMGIY